MKISIPFSNLSQKLPVVLRQAGYQLYRTQGSELVFSRRLSRTNFFPRFHMYLHQTENGWEGNLHYDLRQTVQAHPVHGEEYDGEIVEEEYNRILPFIKNHQSVFSVNATQPIKSIDHKFGFIWLVVGVVIIILAFIIY